MQNSSPNQMLMMTTRIGHGTKLVITGDLKQSDRQDENGLLDLMTKLKNYQQHTLNNGSEPQIKLVELRANDIERSPIVAKILDIYKNKKTSPEATEPQTKLPSQTQNLTTLPHIQTPVNNTTQSQSMSLMTSASFIDISKNTNNDAALIPVKDMNIVNKHWNSLQIIKDIKPPKKP
jgi:hypothetical protein